MQRNGGQGATSTCLRRSRADFSARGRELCLRARQAWTETGDPGTRLAGGTPGVALTFRWERALEEKSERGRRAGARRTSGRENMKRRADQKGKKKKNAPNLIDPDY